MANNTLQHKEFLCKIVFGSIEWELALLSSTGTLRFLRQCLHNHTQSFILHYQEADWWSTLWVLYTFFTCFMIVFFTYFSPQKKSRKKICILVLVLTVIIVILGFILWIVNKWSDCLQPSPIELFSRASACWSLARTNWS